MSRCASPPQHPRGGGRGSGGDGRSWGRDSGPRAWRADASVRAREQPARLLPVAGHPPPRAAPFNFPAPLPTWEAIPAPLHVNAPHGQWARSGREPSANGRGAAVRASTASPRDWLRAGSARAAAQGLGRAQWGHGFIRSLRTGARGQRHFPTEERRVTPRRLARGRLAKFPLPRQSPGRAKPSYRRSSGCVASTPSSRPPSWYALAKGFTDDR